MISNDSINAIGGTIGSLLHPLGISTSGILLVGADGLADFEGPFSSVRFKLIPSNAPCPLIYNGTVLFDCKGAPSTQNLFKTIPKTLLFVPGLYSSWNNLSNDEYFLQEALQIQRTSRFREV